MIASSVAGGIDGCAVLGFEAIEAPDEGEAEVAGHVAHFHSVVLSGMVDCHGRRPTVEDVIGFQVEFTASFLPKLPFEACIHFPH